jgi:hypothetical protein
MPPRKKRIHPFGDDARRRVAISGLAGDLSQARDAIWQKTGACGLSARRRHVRLRPDRANAGRGEKPLCFRDKENQARGPNSTSTGVGVLTSVLNFSLPVTGWIRNTAMLSVFWLAA